MIEWFNDNWVLIIAPLSVFVAFCIIGLWARSFVYGKLMKLLSKSGWGGREILVRTTRGPFFFWIILLGAYIAFVISSLDKGTKDLAAKIIASIFIISLIWMLMILSDRLLALYSEEIKTPRPVGKHITNGIRVTLLVVGILILIDFWGWPITPVLLILAAVILVVLVATRDAILNIFSGFEITASRLVKEGDFVKLGSGVEGYVTDIGWMNIKIKTMDQNIVVMPNSKLVKETVMNYGYPLKKAGAPFQFYTRLHLKELTGLKAQYLTELIDILKAAPDAVIYYHTYHFLEEHQYLTPEPANDFALWVGDALDDDVLSEKLANIDTFAYSSISALREALLLALEQHLEGHPGLREKRASREFYFIKSISFVLPTSYVASDLREFVEVIRKISTGSLYYHVFESRLRLQKRSNDFSVWIRDQFGEDDLADRIDALFPYTYTLEALRSTIIEQVEKRIK